MAIIFDPKSWPVDNQRTRQQKGRLIRVQIGPDQYRKMYEADAERLGLIKARSKPEDKMIERPADTKAEEPVKADDFTAIPGVGKAAARALVAHGITTFEQLRQAGELDYLSGKINRAIEEWRQND
jgi:predicted flap endonuclease-1-like 5' DNA nuclease